MTLKVYSVVFVFVSSATAAISACSTYGASRGDADASAVDASFQGDALGTTDASAAYDGPPTFCSSQSSAFFCDDYDRPADSTGYQGLTGNGTQSRTTLAPFSAPSARRFSLPARETYAHSLWFVNLPQAPLKSVTMDVRFRLSGGLDDRWPMTLVGLTTQANNYQKSIVTFSIRKTDATVVAFNEESTAKDSETSIVFPAMTEGEWHRLTLIMTYPGTNGAGGIEAIVDGVRKTVGFAARRTTGNIISLGAVQYTGTPVSAADVYLDDAVINVEQ
jgi:hypothetical protein